MSSSFTTLLTLKLPSSLRETNRELPRLRLGSLTPGATVRVSPAGRGVLSVEKMKWNKREVGALER